jgi:hypothetical protein
MMRMFGLEASALSGEPGARNARAHKMTRVLHFFIQTA